ncbi:MAG: ThuA domain-containing protein [Verrucomicrobiales bacterium]
MKNKNPLYRFILLAVAVAAVLFTNAAEPESPKISVMLLTGQMNRYHDWQVTSARIEKLLIESGRFEVTRVTSPAKGEDMSAFSPDWKKYDVVILDYDGDDWSEATQKSFEEYIANGGGLVVHHSSNNAFPKWKAFNQMIGVGGWGGREKDYGPIVRWRDGHQVLDFETDGGAIHPNKHDFPVTLRDQTHPITRGMPKAWMHPHDELYSRLRGPVGGLHVLATATADTSMRNGTGENEPMLMTNYFGKGRIFHTTLGHVGINEPVPIRQTQCVGYTVTLQRGTEWAASGKVTIPVPEDFPTADKVSIQE